MAPELVTLLTFGTFGVLLLAGVPLAFSALATAALVAVVTSGSGALLLLVSRIYDTSMLYVLITVPLFILMGFVMEKAAIAQSLFQVIHVWTARLPGGLAVGSILAGAAMAAMIGIVGAEIITLGLIALPTMLRRGYDRKLSLGTICASGTLGTMIPPSLTLIVYGLLANVSIGALFAAALVPGLLLAGSYIAYVLVRCSLNPALAPPPPASETALPLAERIRLARGIVLPMLVIVAVLGSIYLGIAAPTEAAAIGVAGALVSGLINRSLRWRDLHAVLRDTGRAIGPVIWVVIGASALVSVYTFTGGAQFLASSIQALPMGPMGIVACMMLMFIALGCFMDTIGIALLTLPIFVPVVTALGLDLVWFGVLFCMCMQFAYLSPPFGPSCFYLKSVAPPDVSIQEIFSSIWPFAALQGLNLIVLMAFPSLVLWFGRAVG
jgi:tripartite ATP-independent transporter DctM subunit